MIVAAVGFGAAITRTCTDMLTAFVTDQRITVSTTAPIR